MSLSPVQPPMSPEELVANSERLFALPEAYLRLQEKMQEPNVSIHELAKLISQDADITARLLRLVNGPVFGFRGRVDTVSRAIALIGMRELEMLMLATVAAESFQGIDVDVANMAMFWQHSVFCAVCSQILAKRAGVLNPERLFVAGLLHDIGSLVIWKEVTGAASKVLRQTPPGSRQVFALEQGYLGYDHGEVGAALLKFWHLPAGIQATTLYHHSPQRAEHHLLDACIVHIADQLAASRELPQYENFESQCDPVAWRLLKLSAENIKIITGEALLQFMDAVELLLPEMYRTRL